MKPRLASSKKWTSFPKELILQIQDIFQENFEKQLDAGKFIAEGRIFSEEILFRIGFSPNGRLFQANFEASIDYSDLEKIQDAIDICMDATAAMIEEYYKAEESLDLPRNWTEYQFEEKQIYLQFSPVNTELEALADKLLGESSNNSLVNEVSIDNLHL